jgi:hypothetical protein
MRVPEWIAQAGGEETALASSIRDWAETHPYIQVAGGTGVAYPSIIMSADTGRPRSRHRGVLALYGSPAGEPPMLEIRVKRMCRTPPYNRTEERSRLITDLKRLGIQRLDTEADLAGKRPNIPLTQLTGGRTQQLLALVDRWTDDVRAHADEPETANES